MGGVLPVCGGVVDLNAGCVAGQGAQRAAHHIQLPALRRPGRRVPITAAGTVETKFT
jgi:hypothetical protein